MNRRFLGVVLLLAVALAACASPQPVSEPDVAITRESLEPAVDITRESLEPTVDMTPQAQEPTVEITREPQDTGAEITQEPLEAAVEATREPLQVASAPPTLIYFHATWCPTCQQMNPIVDELQKEYDGRVVFNIIDIDEPSSKELKQQYGFRAQPYFVLLNSDEDVFKTWYGVVAADDFRGAFDALIGG